MRKKTILISVIPLVVIGIFIICLIAQNENDEENKKEGMILGTFPRYVEGKIIEIVDDNNVIVQFMEDTYTFKAGDKMKVEYAVAFYDSVAIKIELKENDEIRVMFLEGESIKKEDGYYIYKENEVYLVPEDETISGKIHEIYDNKVLIEVDSGNEKEDGQKIMVEYENYYEKVNDEAKLTSQNPNYGDYVWVMYSTEDATEMAGQKIIKCKMIVHTN